MKISLVMTTYNGDKYLLEQLASLKDQTMVADEVLILDDCSCDNTVLIIKNFINKWNLSNWVVSINDKNIGWRANFYKAISNSSGDYIFLCDQDDIWDIKKIEEMTSILKKNKDILLLSSNYKQKFEKDATSFYNEKFINNGSIMKCTKSYQFLNISRPGCTYCFRKELVPYFKKVWCNNFAHDALLWRTAFCLGGLYVYNHSLVTFRRHSNNSTPNFKKINSLKQICKLLKSLNGLYLEKNSIYQFQLNKTKVDYESCRKFILLRILVLQKFNLGIMFKLLRYHKFYVKFPREYLSDIYHSIFRK